MNHSSAAVLAALLLAAGCAAGPAAPPEKTLDEKLAEHGYRQDDKVDRILRWNVDGWSRIDDEHVVFSAGPSRDYLVTLQSPCRGLLSATAIGFTSTLEAITPLDKLVVRDSGFTDQCPITELHALKRVKK